MIKEHQFGAFTNLLTIAIPVFERKDYFIEALGSALNQTVKCEVIVVDNCSSHDFFEKVCKEKGVTYFRNDTNIGMYPNFNKCFNLSKTEYVKLLDDDDILSPIYVESFLRAKELHPDIDIFFSDYVMLTKNGELSHSFILPFGYIENGKIIIEYGVKYNLGFPYMSSTIKKAKAKSDFYLYGWKGGYDWEWIYSNADQFTFYGDPAVLYQFRIHKKQTSRNIDLCAHTLTVPYIYDKILPEKLSDPKLIKKASKKASLKLIYLKSYGNKNELTEIIQADNRYGKYLKWKLNENFLLKIIFILPRGLVRIIYMILRIINWINRQIHNLL